MSDTIFWYATRGAGAVSMLLLSGVVVLGLQASLRRRTACRAGGMSQHLAVDRIRCDGRGGCRDLLPEIVELDP